MTVRIGVQHIKQLELRQSRSNAVLIDSMICAMYVMNDLVLVIGPVFTGPIINRTEEPLLSHRRVNWYKQG